MRLSLLTPPTDSPRTVPQVPTLKAVANALDPIAGSKALVSMPDAHPLVVGWRHSAARNSPGWWLRARGPLEWLQARGLIDVLEIDERGAFIDAPLGPGIAFGSWSFHPRVVRTFRACGYRIVMGLDDDCWTIPESVSGPGDNSAALGLVEAVLAESDVVVVTTAPLAAAVTRHASARAVCVIPNALPVDVIELSRPNLGQKEVRIGWAGSPTHGDDWDAVRTPVEAILQRPEVRVVLLTKNAPTWLAAHPRVEIHKPVDFSQYYWKLSTLHLDLALAPLAAHVFNESKSNLKALDFAALGLPLVASRVGPYASLPHGQTCLTIPDNDAGGWLDALTELVEDPERRRAMGQAARAWVETHGSLDQTGPQWADALGLPSPARATGAA
jgi:hypothetical protein